MDLSILIPARNEEYLGLTVQDILQNIEGKTEIIVVLDGYDTPVPALPDDPRLVVIKHDQSIGQRAATNEAARAAKGKYLMKVDAHCTFDKGFDVKLMTAMAGHDDWTVVPMMKNLHVFDWVCPDAKPRIKFGQHNEPHRRYQSPSGPCADCGKPTVKEIIWKPNPSPNNASYTFDPTPHFQYFKSFMKRPEGKTEIAPTMSLQGSCFMCTAERYWTLKLCDEVFGSWGSQGIEVACKTWLSGGQVMSVKTTWYAHMFRTQGGDFGFPYPMSSEQQAVAKQKARDMFFNQKWEGQKYPLSWLVRKFWPVDYWTEKDLEELEDSKTKGIIYYTDNLVDEKIGEAVRDRLKEMGLPIVSASLKPLNFGKNIHLPLERGYLTMAKQILAALEASTANIIYFCEHDVLYHRSHFDFIPPKKDTYYYNTNVWKVRSSDGHAIRTDDMRQLSGLCAYRELLVEHYRQRVKLLEEKSTQPEFNKYVRQMGFEPGTHNRPEKVDNNKSDRWESEWPNVDIRHDKNLTPSRWSPSEFRNQRYAAGWKETDTIPGWGKFKDLI